MDFMELEVVGCLSLRHRHVVEMLGYGIAGNDLLLVNEYMSQGSLARRLFEYQDENMDPPLTLSWTWRLKIAMDVAQALDYIHGFGSFCVHVTSISILPMCFSMTTSTPRSKVSGFGFENPFPRGSLPQGADPSGGYMTPEYNWVWWRTKAAHVYSFGVVVMELLTGRPKVYNEHALVTLFWEAQRSKLGSATLHATMDPNLDVLGLNFDSDESMTAKGILAMAELALDCTLDKPEDRPDMDQVVSVLRRLLFKEGMPTA